MFDGVPDQFHQFITPRTSSLPLHLPFPLHATNNNSNNNNPNNTAFPSPFDPYNHHHHELPPLHQVQPNLLHPAAPLHPPSSSSGVHNNKHEEKEENTTTNAAVRMNFEIERDQRQQLPELVDPWTNDEVLALLRIRSTMESWFPQLTWEQVSRKMAELGYKRSAEKCKEKFEEESRYFNNIGNNNNNNYGKSSGGYRFLSELEELYQGGGGGDHPHHHHQEVIESEKNQNPSEGHEDKIMCHALEDNNNQDGGASVTRLQEEHDEEVVAGIMEERTNKEIRKRKRGGGSERFEMFKGFCESIVHKMMEQQEEMHNKLIEDMVRRDEEKFAKEEAWKKQEMERMNKELEIMAHEQAIAGDRQANIIEFLKKFAPHIQGLVGIANHNTNARHKLPNKVTTNLNGSNPNSAVAAAATILTSTTCSPLHSQNPNPSTIDSSSLLHQPTPSSAVIVNNPSLVVAAENPSSSISTHPAQDTLQVASSTTTPPPPAGSNKNPSSSSLNNDPMETNSFPNKATTIRVSSENDDIGRRWPKDEVLALINLRCTSQNNNNNNNNNNGEENNKEANKAPLWERISQGMMELGYKRSAKRCKEKWENINKYFRKTKDVNKKRSLDSRTCPYFHHLSNLYSQGKLVLQSERQENHQLSNDNNNNGNVVVADQNQTQQLAETSSSQVGSGGCGGGFSVQQVDHGGEKTLMQVPSLDFDQF